jgi:hypothetical protein
LFWTADRLLREAVKALLGAEVLLCAQLKRAQDLEELGALLRAAMDEGKNAAPDVTTDGINTAMSDENAATPEVMDIETAAPEPADDYLDSDDVDEQEAGVDAEPDTKPIAPEQAHLPSVPVRDLSALLAALKCEAANKVRLKKVAAQRAPTIEGARENALAVKGLWSASFEKRSIAINRAERDVLEAAGAEFPLSRYWDRCE